RRDRGPRHGRSGERSAQRRQGRSAADHVKTREGGLRLPGRAQLVAAALSLCCGCSHVSAPDVPTRQARRWLEEGQPEKAIAVLSELRRRAPDDLGVARGLVEAYVRADRTGELIAELSGGKSPSAVTHYMLGLAHLSRSADADGPGIAELRAAIALAPDQAELHHALALALLQ